MTPTPVLPDSFYEAAKFAGIALTALLGAIGVLGDFRTPDKKNISRYGYLMIAGVIASGALTIVATAHDDHAQEEQTRKIVQNTEGTVGRLEVAVSNIRHVLTQIVDPTFDVNLTLHCAPYVDHPCVVADGLLNRFLAQRKKDPRSLRDEGVLVAVGKEEWWKVPKGFPTTTGNRDFALLQRILESQPELVRDFGDVYFDIRLYSSGTKSVMQGDRLAEARATYSFTVADALTTHALNVIDYDVTNGHRTLTYSVTRLRPREPQVNGDAVSFDGILGGVMVVSVPVGFVPGTIKLQALNGRTLNITQFVAAGNVLGQNLFKATIPSSR